ncbi:hypothetical protein [Rheinheimera sp.]|uniref:hypothetical protein n=1 Tax=Rheinheimera sp. TaxID=1869214 RepID=UPI0037C6854C
MTFVIYILFCVIAVITCWYINPARHESPSKGQRTIAKAWIVFRRTVCFVAALAFFALLFPALQLEAPILPKIGGILFILFFVVMFIYVGIFGQGPNRFSLKDDIALYKEVRKKYKWK